MLMSFNGVGIRFNVMDVVFCGYNLKLTNYLREGSSEKGDK